MLTKQIARLKVGKQKMGLACKEIETFDTRNLINLITVYELSVSLVLYELLHDY